MYMFMFTHTQTKEHHNNILQLLLLVWQRIQLITLIMKLFTFVNSQNFLCYSSCTVIVNNEWKHYVMQLSHQMLIKISAVPAIKQETREYWIGIWLCSGKKYAMLYILNLKKWLLYALAKKCTDQFSGPPKLLFNE